MKQSAKAHATLYRSNADPRRHDPDRAFSSGRVSRARAVRLISSRIRGPSLQSKIGQGPTLPPLLYTGHSLRTIILTPALDNNESSAMSQRNVANGLPVRRSIQLTSLDPASQMISATTK